MAEELKLDRHYHDKKLRLVLRDLADMPADEYARALIRLANVADDSVMREPEFTRAQLPSQGGEAVEVVGYHSPISKDWSYVGRVGWEPLMTVAQHQRILAAATHPADQVAEGVVVSRELLELAYQAVHALAGMGIDGYTEERCAELRQLLAKSEEGKL